MRKTMKLAISCMLVMILISLSITHTVSASALKINYSTASVIKGNYLYLKITGTTKTVTWTSSKDVVANVSKKGKVEAVGIGTAIISGKVGGKKLTCKIKVIPEPYPGYMSDRDIDNELAERDYINDFSDETVNLPTPTPNPKSDDEMSQDVENRVNDILSSGKAVSGESGEDLSAIETEYKEFCKIWIGAEELKNVYKITINWELSDYELKFTKDNKDIYTIKNMPFTFNYNTVYDYDNVHYQYKDSFAYKGDSIEVNQFYFKIEDLIKKRIIEM